MKEKSLLITDLDKARVLLQVINKQLDICLRELEKAGVVKIQDYKESFPFIVAIIDELAELQDDVCQTALNRTLKIGRAAGISVCCQNVFPPLFLRCHF